MVIKKLQHIIILQRMSKHTLFLTKTFNVAMFYIIDYIFLKHFSGFSLYLILVFSFFNEYIGTTYIRDVTMGNC